MFGVCSTSHEAAVTSSDISQRNEGEEFPFSFFSHITADCELTLFKQLDWSFEMCLFDAWFESTEMKR